MSLDYVYDAANQLLSETYTFPGVGAPSSKMVGFSYDSDGNRATLTYPEGMIVASDYTQRNQLASLTSDGPPPIASFAYDLAGAGSVHTNDT